jgi:hypothetical protein
MPESVRTVGYAKFKNSWITFINSTYTEMCKNVSLITNNINITNIYPSYGPNDLSIKVTIFGYGYETFLCKEIKCVFGNVETSGLLNKLNEIVCDSPVSFKENDVANVSIRADNATFNTSVSFRFVSSKKITVNDDESLIVNKSARVGLSFNFFIFILVVYFNFRALEINFFIL